MGAILAVVELTLVVSFLVFLAVRATPRRRFARQLRQARRAIDRTFATAERRMTEAARHANLSYANSPRPSQGWSLGRPQDW